MKSIDIQPVVAFALATCSAVTLQACGGGGGGGGSGSAQATITVEEATENVDTVASVVANCDATPSAKISIEGTNMLRELVEVSRAMVAENIAKGRMVTRIKAASPVSGSCADSPGVAYVDSTHANGITDYTIDFQDYCAEGPDGNSFYKGVLTAKEVGTPSDSGPIISELQMATEELEVKPGGATGDTVLVTLQNARTVYGVPDTWAPGTPTAADPDLTTVGRLKVDVATRGEVHELSGVSVTREGGDVATVKVTAGRYINPEGKYVDIATPAAEPAVIDIAAAEVTSGALEATGAGGSTARITRGDQPRTVAVSVDGAPLDKGLDCTDIDAPLTETVSLLLSQLPIH